MNPSEAFIIFAKDLGPALAGVFFAVSQNEGVRSAVGLVRAVFIVLTAVLTVLVVWFARKANIVDGWRRKYYEWYRPAPEKKTKKVGEVWGAISAAVENPADPLLRRRALLAADIVLDFVLDERSLPGGTIRDKLYHVTPAEVRNLAELVRSHQIISTLRQGPRIDLAQSDARRIIDAYAAALADLGFLTPPRL